MNAILPGAIDTPPLNRGFGRHADPAVPRAASLARYPMARFGRAGEVAEAALYLASDASSFTTGTGLVVDGGGLTGQLLRGSLRTAGSRAPPVAV